MDRGKLLAHLRRAHFAPGDRNRALDDARRIADFVKREYGVRVIGAGSLFDPDRRFRDASDIDLVVEGLPADRFFEATAGRRLGLRCPGIGSWNSRSKRETM